MKEQDRCPQCGGELVEKDGKYGQFIACSNYPECTYTQRINKADFKKPQSMYPKHEKTQENGSKREFHLSPEQVNTNALNLAISFGTIQELQNVGQVIGLAQQFRDFITS